ncbi:TonB-dependent receptor domain-containing protein [Polluticaenibacter yanchengensis]|uniref:TonB-dependent receptor n=1 Tax=Polluticaenibacter yanchengensis TaxID=3014562 RepID=A0ABT4UM05_9BACT|nr:TonB-dependent receptor [Chitinophagaceae bacterium LY-5]
MMKLILTTTLTLTSLFALAQANITGKVAGSSAKVEAATITLHTRNNAIAKTAVTDSLGAYKILNVNSGTYYILVSAIGYQELKTDSIVVKSEDINLPVLQLKPTDGTSLEGVVVTVKKPLIETKVDRTILNVDALVSTASNTALEVLEKTPGVSVDKDGNISIKGNQGALVLIDDKPTYMSSQDLANYLKSIPATQLETVELMTQPSAKYDASGTAGIINIRTKKIKIRGFNGNVSLSAIQGVYFKNRHSLNLNYRHDKINAFLSYGYNHNNSFNELSLNRKFYKSSDVVSGVFDQSSFSKTLGRGHNIKYGLDFYATKKTTLGIVVTQNLGNDKTKTNSKTNILDGGTTIDSINRASTADNREKNQLGINFNVKQDFKKKGHFITADLDYLRYKGDGRQDVVNSLTDLDGNLLNPALLLKGNMPSLINIYSAKVDYTYPVSAKGKLEAGGKISAVETDNDAQYKVFDNTWKVDPSRTAHFLYDENINAAYVNYSHQINDKWGFQTGLRMENTVSKGNVKTTGETFKKNYTQLFPTAYLSHKLNDKNTMSLNFGRRINRPSYQSLNPFIYILDKYTYNQGNPYLTPEFTNNFELQHTYKGVLTTTLNYGLTTDIINEILKQDDETKVTFQTKENIAKRKTYGVSVSYNNSVTPWYYVSVFLNLNHSIYNGIVNNKDLEVSATKFNYYINNQFRFKKGWSGEINSFYQTRGLEGGIIVTHGMGNLNFAVGKQILKNMGSIKLSLNDPFDFMRFRGTTKFDNIDLGIRSNWDNSTVGLTFSYRFGKPIKNNPAPRKTGGVNDEINRISSGSN